jgi:hypothetical protein
MKSLPLQWILNQSADPASGTLVQDRPKSACDQRRARASGRLDEYVIAYVAEYLTMSHLQKGKLAKV